MEWGGQNDYTQQTPSPDAEREAEERGDYMGARAVRDLRRQALSGGPEDADRSERVRVDGWGGLDARREPRRVVEQNEGVREAIREREREGQGQWRNVRAPQPEHPPPTSMTLDVSDDESEGEEDDEDMEGVVQTGMGMGDGRAEGG